METILFCYDYRINGRKEIITFGKYCETSLADILYIAKTFDIFIQALS